MKTIQFETYGSPEVIQIKEVPVPTPKDDEVLIKVHAATVSSGDVRVRSSTFPPGFWLIGRLMLGLFKPRETGLGNELAGVVEAVGKNVKGFRKGDAVYGALGLTLGANAEYVCLPEDGPLAPKPANMSFEEAAAVPFGALTSLIFLRDKGHIRPGQKVLINGASGSLGTYAVQLAKHFGAEVTAVCSAKNVALVQSLGADHVVDYTKTDISQSGGTYNIIYDTVGKISFSQSKRLLRPKGIHLAAVAGTPDFLHMLWTSITGGKKIIGGVAPQTKEDLLFLNGLIEAGKLKAVIDRRYPLEQIAEAHRYVEGGHKRGNVVLTV